MNYFKLILSFLLFSQSAQAQVIKTKWNNKDKGTFITDFNHIGIFPRDSAERGIPNSKLIGISVKLFELSNEGPKRIEGKVRINNREYIVYDSSDFVDAEGYKDPTRFFGIWAQEGIYSLSANAGTEYYEVSTEKIFLPNGTSYQFQFFLVRKDLLRRTNCE